MAPSGDVAGSSPVLPDGEPDESPDEVEPEPDASGDDGSVVDVPEGDDVDVSGLLIVPWSGLAVVPCEEPVSPSLDSVVVDDEELVVLVRL